LHQFVTIRPDSSYSDNHITFQSGAGQIFVTACEYECCAMNVIAGVGMPI